MSTGFELDAARRREVVLHEQAGIHGEAGGEEGFVDRAGVVEQKLRLDPLDAGGVMQELEQLVEKGLRDLKHLRGVVGYGEGVADDGLLAFVDAEGEAADASAVERDKAGQDAGVEILQEQLGGALVVPAQALLPEARLGFEQRAQLTRGEMAEIQDLELGRDCHTLLKYSFELIGIRGVWVRRCARMSTGSLTCFGVDPVDFEALRFVEKERLVDASGEPAVELGGVVRADDEQMFGVGNAVGVVVDHRLIAVEGETVVHVALDGLGGDELDVGSLALNLAGQRTGGVVHVELFAVEAEQEDQRRKDRNQRRVAHLGDAPAANDEQDDGSEAERRCGGDRAAIAQRARGSRTSCAGARARGRRP